MRIESDTAEINKSASEVFFFLSDFSNFRKLMPPQITHWQSTADECSFTINGMATIGMKITEKIPHSLLKISSSGKTPFDFTLHIHLTEKSSSQTMGQIVFEAELNPTMTMLMEKPLRNFFNLLSAKMKEM